MRKTAAVLVMLMLVMTLIAIPVLANGSNSSNNGKSGYLKPSPATDIELFKKVTLKGSTGSKGGKPTKTTTSATGVLGEPIKADTNGASYAVIVGISDYPGDSSDLEYCDDDADDTSRTLTSIYGFDPEKVIVLKDMDATAEAILGAIASIPENAGEVVFVCSSHGAQGNAADGDKEARDEAIVAHDGTNFVYIWDGDLARAFKRFSSSTRLVFSFDICNAGGMQADLERELAGRNMVIAMACGENQFAYEGPVWQNGEFTYYFIEQGMYYGKADTHDYDGDGIVDNDNVTAEEAFDYAKANCTNDKPVIGDLYTNDLLFNY